MDRLETLVLSAVSERWVKAAMVAATVMAKDGDIDDRDVQQSLKSLALRGAIEVAGDLADLRSSEVRRSPGGEVMSNNELERP